MPSGKPWNLELFLASTARVNRCVEWIGYRDPNGYGDTYYRGKKIRTHRLSWILHRGPIPDGVDILHRCDNPPCVNVDHLFAGTARDNIRDMVSKGRHGSATLSPEQVRRIRVAIISGERQKDIARRFGTTQQRVSDINRGRHFSAIC